MGELICSKVSAELKTRYSGHTVAGLFSRGGAFKNKTETIKKTHIN